MSTDESVIENYPQKEAIWVHWTTALLVVFIFAIGWGHELVEGRAAQRTLMDVHRVLGLIVAVLTLARLALRVRWPALIEPETSPLLRLAAKGSHGLLYLLLLALPVVGFVMTGAARAHPTLFGVIPIPSFTGHDRDLADQLGEWHERGAWALLAIIGLHAAAALWHHHVKKDDVLARMVPQLRRG